MISDQIEKANKAFQNAMEKKSNLKFSYGLLSAKKKLALVENMAIVELDERSRSFVKGVFHIEMKQYDEAISHLEVILKRNCSDYTRETIVRNLLCMVLASLLKKDFELAKKYTQRIIQYQLPSGDPFPISQSNFIEDYVINLKF